MKNSAIEWTDHTFNPWIGCTKVSPACDHCYAEALMDKRMHKAKWGAGQPRVRTSASNWHQPVKWNAEAAAAGKRARVFCASLADVFDNEVPAAWRVDLFRLIRDTPSLDWLLLTKRIGNATIMLADVRLRADEYMDGFPWPNVWIGATICNQEEADRDIPKLLKVPARRRFLSIEPMLGSINLRFTNGLVHGCDAADYLVDWVIVGGESGPNARPMDVAWARSLHQQCTDAGVSFFMKQMGGARDKRGALTDLPDDLRVREVPCETK